MLVVSLFKIVLLIYCFLKIEVYFLSFSFCNRVFIFVIFIFCKFFFVLMVVGLFCMFLFLGFIFFVGSMGVFMFLGLVLVENEDWLISLFGEDMLFFEVLLMFLYMFFNFEDVLLVLLWLWCFLKSFNKDV